MQEDLVAIFRGIPYALPPVGRQRFAAPATPQPWDGVRDAIEFGPPAPQRRIWDAAGSDDSADWLTLNVWSPDLGNVGLPVMVWIHGGAYQQDTSANPHYDCAALAAAGAVVISMNYRLGAEGFAHIDGAPDNRGLLDQAAALRWVQGNVTAFGGDPANVTIFGQSAGAGSIAALLSMPSAAGLFRRAIVQSLPGTYFSNRLAAAISTAIAAELGTTPTVENLCAIAPNELVRATEVIRQTLPQHVDRWGPMAMTPTPFSPVVDGDVLPHAPWSALAAGAARGIDLLVGHTRDEYRLVAARFGGEVSDQRLTETLDRLAPAPDGGAAYRAAWPDVAPATLYETVNADWLMRMPTLHLAAAQIAGGGRSWMYELAWGFGPAGASHSLDVLLLLGTLDYDDVRDADGSPGEAARLSEQMRIDWLSFATTGHPGWAPYNSTSRTTRVYDVIPTVQPYPEAKSQHIWRGHRFGILDLLD